MKNGTVTRLMISLVFIPSPSPPGTLPSRASRRVGGETGRRPLAQAEGHGVELLAGALVACSDDRPRPEVVVEVREHLHDRQVTVDAAVGVPLERAAHQILALVALSLGLTRALGAGGPVAIVRGVVDRHVRAVALQDASELLVVDGAVVDVRLAHRVGLDVLAADAVVLLVVVLDGVDAVERVRRAAERDHQRHARDRGSRARPAYPALPAWHDILLRSGWSGVVL